MNHGHKWQKKRVNETPNLSENTGNYFTQISGVNCVTFLWVRLQKAPAVTIHSLFPAVTFFLFFIASIKVNLFFFFYPSTKVWAVSQSAPCNVPESTDRWVPYIFCCIALEHDDSFLLGLRHHWPASEEQWKQSSQAERTGGDKSEQSPSLSLRPRESGWITLFRLTPSPKQFLWTVTQLVHPVSTEKLSPFYKF